MNDSEKVAFLMNKVKEQEFKLKALENFVFAHHHAIDSPNAFLYTTKPTVSVKYPDGWKEEPLNANHDTKKDKV